MGILSILFKSKKSVEQTEFQKELEERIHHKPIEKIQRTSNNTMVKPKDNKPKDKFSFSVGGSEEYQDNFKKVMKRNNKYKSPNKKTIDEGMSDTVCEYKPITTNQDVTLVDDSTNLFVVYKGEILGFIKKGSVAKVKNLIKGKHELELKLYGGNTREYYDIDDFDEEEDILKCRLTIYMKEVV